VQLQVEGIQMPLGNFFLPNERGEAMPLTAAVAPLISPTVHLWGEGSWQLVEESAAGLNNRCILYGQQDNPGCMPPRIRYAFYVLDAACRPV
jgi:hypothetical protein